MHITDVMYMVGSQCVFVSLCHVSCGLSYLLNLVSGDSFYCLHSGFTLGSVSVCASNDLMSESLLLLLF